MALIAMIAMFATSFSFVSCSDDDVSNEEFTFSVIINTGDMGPEYASMYKAMESTRTVSCTKAEALAAYEEGVKEFDAQIPSVLNDIKGMGFKGMSVVYRLSQGSNVLKEKTWE